MSEWTRDIDEDEADLKGVLDYLRRFPSDLPFTRDDAEAILQYIARVRELQARPKLWVVRVPYPTGLMVRANTVEIGSVDIGDCGDAVPCIAAFDRRTDADYVAACVGGTAEEWGAK